MFALMFASALAVDVELPHQGRLTDVEGNPVNGSPAMTLTLWDDATASGLENRLFSETFSSVPVDNGYYSVRLGSNTTPLDSSVFAQPEIWLGVTVAPNDEGIRSRLHHVPYAAHARGVTLGNVPGACGSEVEVGTLRYASAKLEICSTDGEWRTVDIQEPKDGSTAERAAVSCDQLHREFPLLDSGTYWLHPEGESTANPFQAYCEMTLDGGGWTLVMKLRADTLFQWNSSHWTSQTVVNETDLTYTTDTNAKYASFNRVAGTRLMYTRPNQTQFMRFDFASPMTPVAIFASGANHVATGGGWRPPESHNNTSNTQCSSFSSSGRGVNYTQSCDSISQGSRVRLGEGYEQAGVAHCIWGLGTFNNPCAQPTSGFGSPGGNMRLFVR